MKKWLMMMALFTGIVLTGCKEDANSVSAVESTEADADILDYSAARYGVASDSVTSYKCKGKLTEVAAEDLNTSITEYLETNYSEAVIKYAGQNAEGKTVVALSLADGTATGLLFAADGSFVEELKSHAKRARLIKVELDALPTAITTYLTETYADFTPAKAGTNEAGEYLVVIGSEESKKVILFNADGSFNKELEIPKMIHKRKRK
ncbi:hypothetical protein CLV98_102180 [Dyadobacter jejuensis]|uniref:Uncharacterized protein n=1 Tax=Dyadobacter jejuensis TaxID=1082580 RepID=A0A316B9Y0_9BACT|nr:hypothetical protein [Dyadobacter jejuensis]PWJ59347.1 hypothetical protein CLV98_102180 [Dyadobacter jejuensis]